jgi:hypothetical protein
MVPLSRRAATGLLAVALACALLVATPGCSSIEAIFRGMGTGGDEPQWQIARFKGVTSTDVLRLAQTAVEREYPPQRLDSYRGEFETGWVYGLFDDVGRHPLRQRIVVHAAPEEGVLVVRLRAQQEVNDAGGRFAGPQDDGWEAFVDNPVRAQTMMQRLCILLKDIGEKLPDPKPEDEKS